MVEQGATRTNISLPRDLKERMDAVKESVNWSAIAARAFETHLAELNARKKGATMTDAIARLKAADAEDSNETRQEGREAGEKWAGTEARPKELRRLESFTESELYTRHFGDNDGSAYSWPEIVYFAMRPEHDQDRSWSEDFWGASLGSDEVYKLDEIDFLQGFIEGAVEFWEKAKKGV